jgi:5-methylcytosine-specific restriction endonuclease McrA
VLIYIKRRSLLKKLKDFVYARDKVCVKCGSEDGLAVDHILPYKLGGASFKAGNLQLLCRACHLKKTLEDYKKIKVARLETRKKIHLEFHPECVEYPIHSKICSKNAKNRAKWLSR